MDGKCIGECNKLIKKYKTLKDEKKRQETRNKLFDIIYEDLLKWVSSLLSRKKIFISQQELISLSWDCFEFGLSKFNKEKNITVPKHFYAHCNYYITSFWLKQHNDEINKGDGDLEHYSNDYGDVYEIQDGIKVFRESLTPKYQKIFDDALMSMGPKKLGRVRSVDELHIPYYRYDEAKKIFIMTLKFMLNKS